MIRFLRFATLAFLFIFTGCSSLAPVLPTPTSAPVDIVTATPRPDPTQTAPTQAASQKLIVWLPPQFDPSAETESMGLLNQRLKAFEVEHPGLNIEVRIKGGGTDIVNFLSVTNNAAPASMPDLIALSYDQMQDAASRGYLHPLDGLTNILQDPDWYVFARELSSVQNAAYGIPFAADALMTIYRPALFEAPPSTWDSIIESGALLAFAASDPGQYLSLSLYLSVGGQLADAQGVFTLNENALVSVLSLYQSAYESEAFPLTIKEFQTDARSLNSYRSGESSVAVVWASSDIRSNSGAYDALLGLDDVPYSIGDGWVWALAGSNTESQLVAVELASYLTESEYMSEWTYISGYLPTRPLSLAGWEDDAVKGSMDDVLLSAHPSPAPDLVASFGSIMQGALIRIFNGEQAEVVARSVVESLK